MKPGLVVAARPLAVDFRSQTRPFTVALVKDWLQAGGHLTGLDPGLLRKRELGFWRTADLVCAVSSRLQQRLAEDGVPSVLLRHGYDASRQPKAGSSPAIPDLAGLPRPLLGCAGRIDGRWAFEALEGVARAHQGGSIVLLGPVSHLVPREAFGRLLALPNVHHFDAVSGDLLPAWLEALDCCLVPYLEDEWQRYASPLKVWDYFHAGRPIVATGAPALGDFPPGLIHFAPSPSALPALVEVALAEDRATAMRLRRSYALENTWEQRADQLMALVADRRKRRTAGVAA